MPRGAAVIRYEGKRNITWYAKYRDATNRQVKERLGTETEGWTRQKAERKLRKRLDRVERERWRKPDRETFAAFADRFRDACHVQRGPSLADRLSEPRRPR